MDLERKIEIVFLIKDGYRVEIISPLDKSSAYYGLLKRYRNTYYHVCYELEDIDDQIQKLIETGYIVLQKPKPAVAMDGKRVCFLLHPDMGIIELLEKESETK